MRPRVFVSSTYYDLKHVRERIEKFISNYGFESVLFESDKVTYELEKPIDESAYNEVTLCHLMILIIGGRYGTSSSADSQNEHKKYENEFVSITRREFETAVSKNIPVFVFIDKNVYSEYQTFKENQDFLENLRNIKDVNPKMKFKFAHVDSVNVFKFIDIVKSKPIRTFDKVDEIENYLQNQIAGLFYLYLDSLQKQKEVKKVLDSVAELNSISLRMNEMLNSVGKKILGNEDHNEYELVIKKQLEMIIDFYANQFYELFSFQVIEDLVTDFTQELYLKISQFIYEEFLKNEVILPEIRLRIERMKWINNYNYENEIKLNDFLLKNNINFKVEKGEFYRANYLYHLKVKPFIAGKNDVEILINRLKVEIEFLL